MSAGIKPGGALSKKLKMVARFEAEVSRLLCCSFRFIFRAVAGGGLGPCAAAGAGATPAQSGQLSTAWPEASDYWFLIRCRECMFKTQCVSTHDRLQTTVGPTDVAADALHVCPMAFGFGFADHGLSYQRYLPHPD